jgi:hypothetical protein
MATTAAARPITSDGATLIGLPLAFAVVGWEQLLHTSQTAPPLQQVLHWTSDSLMALPLAAAAVWLGSRIAASRGLGNSRSDTLVRGLLIALLFAFLLVPGGLVHEQIDQLLSYKTVSLHTHAGLAVARDWRDPVVVGGLLSHAFSDGLMGQLVGLPLVLAALAWLASRRSRSRSAAPRRLNHEGMTHFS